MTSVGSNLNIFCVDVHVEQNPSPSACVQLSLTPPPCGRHKWMAHYQQPTAQLGIE